MAILYIASEAMELKPFAAQLTGLRRLKWPLDYAYEGILNGKRILLAANGAGRRLVLTALQVALRAITAAELSASKLDAIFSVGFCGALDPTLDEHAIVVASDVLDAANTEVYPCCGIVAENNFVLGRLISQDRIANDAEEKKRLGALGAVAVDMESAFLAAETRRTGVPFYCIKVVSDRASESFPFDLNEMRTTEGRVSRGKIRYYAITHPRLIPYLIQLKRRSENGAKALGDFLVSCRIKPETDSAVAG